MRRSCRRNELSLFETEVTDEPTFLAQAPLANEDLTIPGKATKIGDDGTTAKRSPGVLGNSNK